jgi:hypothetical protein
VHRLTHVTAPISSKSPEKTPAFSFRTRLQGILNMRPHAHALMPLEKRTNDETRLAAIAVGWRDGGDFRLRISVGGLTLPFGFPLLQQLFAILA